MLQLELEKHLEFILNIFKIPQEAEAESSASWIIYWSLSALKLLEHKNYSFIENVLKMVQDKAKNLFSSQYKGITHLGNIYSSVATLYQFDQTHIIEKQKIFNFFIIMKNKNGSFHTCENGENDIRGIYCVLAVCVMLDLNFSSLMINSKKYILSCQTYEGGFASFPGGEAHGGYTYCAIACLKIFGAIEECNLLKLCEWLMDRKDTDDHGLNGRTNKKSDSCYGFWIGAVLKIIEPHINLIDDLWIKGVTMYILRRQDKNGGFSDKENGQPDVQHTCYSLFFLKMFDQYPNGVYVVDPVLGVVTKSKY